MSLKLSDEKCPLCMSDNLTLYGDDFLLCSVCEGIFRIRSSLLNAEEEKKRYEHHNNDVNDLRYREFVRPVTDAVIERFDNRATGIDFGSGKSPATAKVLQEKGYDVSLYDPYFHIRPELLNRQYEFIICCEVAEHFNSPAKEFSLLKKMMKSGSALFIMTHIYDKSLDFEKWYYKNDKTHVFIYQKSTFEWIKRCYGFKEVNIDKRLITFIN